MECLNDSENYLELVRMGKMTYDVLNHIQSEQNKAYLFMINYTLESYKAFFESKRLVSLDYKKLIELKVEAIEQLFEREKILYTDVITPRMHRKIRYGAKFITSDQYKGFLNGHLDAKFPPSSSYFGKNRIKTPDGHVRIDSYSLPIEDQTAYARMEVQVLYHKWLKDKLSEEVSSNHQQGDIIDESENESKIGVKAWAIVFYYTMRGDEIKISDVEEFKTKHNLKCSTDSLKNKIYSVRKEITEAAPKRSIISQIEKAIDVLRLYYPGKVWSAEDSLRDIKVDIDHQSN
ncbi:hypothetical protein [Parapedobacter composti]|uniref:hypothetical protein n=1 Tax=Parapedobacter composti TaxID=623281 RepID=UPI00111414F0|nr:hypothetical protein [Parapedobacter composti]